MHYHCEIIIPPKADIKESIESILTPYHEEYEDEEGYPGRNGFWDWYVIGGRWAGAKLQQALGKEKIDEFYRWCKKEEITVSSLQCGKQELKPVEQIPKVDAKWNEMTGLPGPCPLFAHSNDQYSEWLPGDISRLDESENVECSRVIFAGPSFDHDKSKTWDGPLEAVFMLAEDAWNGCNHMPVDWDGKIGSALKLWKERLENYASGYRNRCTPAGDWQCVTVDYHS